VRKNNAASEAKSGLRLAGHTLLFISTAMLFVVGVTYAFFPAGHSRLAGWLFLALGSIVMVWKIDGWVKALPGILSWAVLSGIIMLSTGHSLNDASVSISRLDVLVITLFAGLSIALCRPLLKRKLSLVDRIGFLGFASSLAWWLGHESTRVSAQGGRPVGNEDAAGFTAMAVGLACLAVAWIYDRMRRGNHSMTTAVGQK